jgi:hypothetical protein
MSARKFRIGQSVNYRPAVRRSALGKYQVIGFLPQCKDGEPEYQIKHLNEGHERVARESELRSAWCGTFVVAAQFFRPFDFRLEGIVSKRLGSKYRPGPTKCPDWIKVKNPEAPAVKREAEEEWGKRRWKRTQVRAEKSPSMAGPGPTITTVSSP